MKYVLVSVMLLWILFLRLFWLFLLIIFLYLLCWGLLRLIECIRKKRTLKSLLKGILYLLYILSVSISLKLFVFDIYKIPSYSMEQTFFNGDVIWVNKLKYGPRLPRSPFEIPWVNIMFYLNGNSREVTKKDDWKYKRLSGITKIKNGDVMVFDMFDDNMVIVKRCMGIAGDTLKIIDGNVIINGKLFNPSSKIENRYKFSVNNVNHFYGVLDSLNINANFTRTNKNWLEATLSDYEKNLLEYRKLIDSTEIVTDTLPTRFPKSKFLLWTLDNYGPYIIPKMGMTIKLNQVNFDLYNKAINDHEEEDIKKLDNHYYLNGKQIKSYTFKHDYYFMMGDNRKGSQDSRYWGLVPENRIIGKVPCVLFSNYKDEFQWDRFFKAVN